MYQILLICAAMLPASAWAQRTFDLTTVEPDAKPSGVTLEWHSALPATASNIYATPGNAVPGIYYAVFNYGNDCYSAPSPIRVGKTSCPSPTVDLTQFADETKVPSGSEITYHTASPVSDANLLAGDPKTAVPGKYYIAYHDQANACYSNARPLVVLSYENDPSPVALADSSLDNVLTTAVSVPMLNNDTLSNGAVATAATSNVALTTNNLPAGSTLNGDGSVTAAGQGTWTYDSVTGNLTFQPLAAYKDNPKPLTYMLTDANTCKTTTAVAKITYEGAMPVTLVSFGGKAVERSVNLNWKTASEINASHFEIQRSGDAKNFRAIANVPANNAKSSYQFVDQQPLTGTNYYRLKMIDLDSTYSFSKVIHVRMAGAVTLSLYPNPVGKELKINVDSESGLRSVRKVTFYDQAGQMRYATERVGNGSVDVRTLADGLYLLRILCEDGTTLNSRILIKK